MKTPKIPPQAIPYLRELEPHEDYPVQLSSLDNAANIVLISTLFVVEPKMLDDLIFPQVLTDRENDWLESAIDRKLTHEVRGEMGEAIRKLIARVALSNKVAPWREYARRLQETKKGIELLLASIKPRENSVKEQGYLSASHAIEKFLETRGVAAETLQNLIVQCYEQLEIVQMHASKRGVKADISLHLFMRAVVSIAQKSGADLVVGMHKEKQDPSDEMVSLSPDTPLLKFAHAMLNCARVRAPAAFSESYRLTADDQTAALRRFDELMQKDGRALQHQLKVAIDTLRHTDL